MTWFDDGDGWRNEDTEGPYDTLRTKGSWSIFRDLGEKLFILTYEGKKLNLLFKSVEKAKEYVRKYEAKN